MVEFFTSDRSDQTVYWFMDHYGYDTCTFGRFQNAS